MELQDLFKKYDWGVPACILLELAVEQISENCCLDATEFDSDKFGITVTEYDSNDDGRPYTLLVSHSGFLSFFVNYSVPLHFNQKPLYDKLYKWGIKFY